MTATGGKIHGPLRIDLAAIVAVALLLYARPVLADSGGISFWLPGDFGSLAAVPPTPGWSLETLYYHTTVSANGEFAAARAIGVGRFSATENATLSGGVSSSSDLLFLTPSYAFATPVLGGQAALSLTGVYGRTSTALNATLTGISPISFTRSDSFNDSLTGFGDLTPQFWIAWNHDVNNIMTYVTGNVPVGAYDPTRLSNMGIGFWAVDSGVGYTYLDMKTGHEFSVVTGLTYNFINPATQYQNGIDWHLDWGASQFLTDQVEVGLVGYIYNQLTGDSGSGDRVGPFISRVFGIGPQISFMFPVAGMQGSLNLKAYEEFDAMNRPDGWNTWVTFTVSPSTPTPAPTPAKPIVTKY